MREIEGILKGSENLPDRCSKRKIKFCCKGNEKECYSTETNFEVSQDEAVLLGECSLLFEEFLMGQ